MKTGCQYLISVVMPALNEQENISAAVRNVMDCFDRLKINGQIVIINDGSKDRTGELAEEFSRSHSFIKVLHHKSPQGIGGSFWDGVLAAEGEMVVMIPGDGENDAYEILTYLPLMEHVDIVVPFVFNKNVRSPARRLLSVMYRGIINMSFGMSLNYMNGTVVYRRAVFSDIALQCKGFFYQTELLIKCIKNGYLYAEVPYALKQRAVGASKATSLKSLKNVIKAYLSTLLDVYFSDNKAAYISPDSVTARRWKDLGKSDS